jgi:hypothetical protein
LARQGRRLLHLGLRPGAQDMERWRRAHQERYRATASAQYIFFRYLIIKSGLYI